MAYHSGALLFRLLRESRPYARYYVFISLGFMISSVAGLGIADGLRRLVDAAAQHSTALLWSGLLVGLGGFTLSELLSFGMRSAFVVVYERLSWPIQTLLRTWPNLQQSLAAAERTYELIDEPLAPGVASNHPQGSSRADLLPIFRIERIEFDHVCFSYPGTPHPVLNDLTFTIDGGKFTAIVGPTGAGKSTIIRLLLRLFDPDSGVIRVFFSSPTPSSDTRGLDILGGTPIQSQSCMELRSIPVSTWRSLIGYVPQEPGLFDVSLEENIRMGRRGLPSPMAVQMGVGTDQVLSDDSEQLEAAVRLALLGDVVKRLPDGLATCIGERGSHLSGGERQRVAIARAAYRNPSLLLLDEATSSLDNVNERLVQRALLGLSAGRTTVAIAHRLSTVMGADRILVVDEGRVIEQGSHEQLLAAGGKYASLFAAGQLLGNGWVVSGPLFFLLGRVVDGRICSRSEAVQKSEGVLRSFLQEDLQNMEVVRAYNLEECHF